MAVVTHLLPEGADLAAARALIDEHADVTAGRVRAGTSTFYDTFDGRLHMEGLTLRHLGGKLTLLDRATGEVLAAAVAPARAEHRLFDRDLAEPLHARLADAIEMRALVPVARVRTREITLGVLNHDQKTVVRLNVETHEGLRGRVSAHAVRGYEKDLERVNALLTDTLSLPEVTVPLVDEAVAATGKPAAGTSAKLNLELDPDAPANVAAADGLRPPARGDRRQLPRHARGRRLRVPARPARRRPPHALAAAPVQDDLSRQGARALPRGVQADPGRHRRPARPRRLPARLRGAESHAARADAA